MIKTFIECIKKGTKSLTPFNGNKRITGENMSRYITTTTTKFEREGTRLSEEKEKKKQQQNVFIDKKNASNFTLDLISKNKLIIISNIFNDNVELEDGFTKFVEKKLRKVLGKSDYAKKHFDGVINLYKECSVESWKNTVIDDSWEMSLLNRFKTRISTEINRDVKFLAPHLLDLAEDGEIMAHVDNLKASGSLIAGVCLKSDAVMILRRVSDPLNDYVTLFLPKGCLYIQR
ncbi:hypothetical protein HK099_007570 [Clydaea vesicula]|uniref:Alpha-ketoglutarate-dependent dioxygenase AlkB-like domain-containing protein n=1 Tax=Clydaea vesicula TaxID=447962 RepID=A0AAD5TWD5_9FUNG|nr:hypothetical protein HK099_007570 [Clydaea vesicula]